MKELLSDLVQYNMWANQKLSQFLRQQDHALLEKEISSSFKSIKSTLLHIWDAQEIWLGRLEGRSMTFFPSKFFEGSMEEVFNGLLNSSSDFLTYMANTDPNLYNEICYYKTTKGLEHQQLRREIIVHCMNHGTYHRGQIITICHQLGITDLQATDYIFYLRRKKE